MIPGENVDDGSRPKDRRSRKYVERPSFSIPTMSYNFRRFNSRFAPKVSSLHMCNRLRTLLELAFSLFSRTVSSDYSLGKTQRTLWRFWSFTLSSVSTQICSQ